jgi:hypothetical protein
LTVERGEKPKTAAFAAHDDVANGLHTQSMMPRAVEYLAMSDTRNVAAEELKVRREITFAPVTLEKTMKRSLLFICIGLLAATTASAQNPPAQSGPNNSAVNSPGQNNSNAPVAGRNSFTEGQAKSKIEDAGYTNVTELKKDDNGVWRGKASKGGAATAVSVDFQGNVNTAK